MEDLISDVVFVVLFEESLDVGSCAKELGIGAFDKDGVDCGVLLQVCQRPTNLIHHFLR